MVGSRVETMRPSYPNWQRNWTQNPDSVGSNPTEGTTLTTNVVAGQGIIATNIRPQPARGGHILGTFLIVCVGHRTQSSENKSAYTSNVIAAEACASIRCTTFTFAPALIARLAAVCRRS